uniref:Uncharacterized protein n=1 Tax=Panagrolaimus sp. JU765 TaxID=591449 RepID=A0AC34PY76_9BILA
MYGAEYVVLKRANGKIRYDNPLFHVHGGFFIMCTSQEMEVSRSEVHRVYGNLHQSRILLFEAADAEMNPKVEYDIRNPSPQLTQHLIQARIIQN